MKGKIHLIESYQAPIDGWIDGYLCGIHLEHGAYESFDKYQNTFDRKRFLESPLMAKFNGPMIVEQLLDQPCICKNCLKVYKKRMENNGMS